jgi:N-acyl-phosphatidylethanolamine-hydrolysing phospholipase D
MWILNQLVCKKINVPPLCQAIVPSSLEKPPKTVRFSWIGHNTVLIQTSKYNILTDPVFSFCVGPFFIRKFHRKIKVPLILNKLPPIDTVLISHDHFDHLDLRTIKKIARTFQPLFIVPLGVGSILKKLNVTYVELDWWQTLKMDKIQFHCNPANHWSGRSLLKGSCRTLWSSWYIDDRQNNTTIYFAGDTAYADHFKNIFDILGAPQFALLPIGSYAPAWLHSSCHLHPQEAIKAFLDLRAHYLIPIHWGTFDISEEPLHEPIEILVKELSKKGLINQLRQLHIGQSFTI